MSKVWCLEYPRPIGMEPLIRTVKPELNNDPNDFNPFSPEVVEFESELEARRHFKNTIQKKR